MDILTLYSNTFVWYDDFSIVVYDSLHYNSKVFDTTPGIITVCKHLLDPKNLYSVSVDLQNTDKRYIDFITELGNGVYGTIHSDDKHIMSLPPLLGFNPSYNEHSQAFNPDEPLVYTIDIYLGGNCPENDYYKHSYYPKSSSNVLAFNDIYEFIERVNLYSTPRLNIIVSNACEYQEFDKLYSYLNKLENNIETYIRIEDKHEILTNYCHKDGITLVVSPDKKEMVDNNKDLKLLYLISDDSDYVESESSTKLQYQLINNGENTLYLQSVIKMSKEQIAQRELTKREIFAHKVLNIHSFGTLKVMPDGYVYSDCYKDAVGTTKNTVLEILSNEFERGGSWLNIRVKNECKCCPYNLLCPSESPIERSIGLKTICK